MFMEVLERERLNIFISPELKLFVYCTGLTITENSYKRKNKKQKDEKTKDNKENREEECVGTSPVDENETPAQTFSERWREAFTLYFLLKQGSLLCSELYQGTQPVSKGEGRESWEYVYVEGMSGDKRESKQENERMSWHHC